MMSFLAVIGQEVSDYRLGFQKNPAEELQLLSELHLCGLLLSKICWRQTLANVTR